MMLNEELITNDVLTQGVEYDIGTNDGMLFDKMVFIGTGKIYGKPVMVFRTRTGSTISINPSYHTFTKETEVTKEKERANETVRTRN